MKYYQKKSYLEEEYVNKRRSLRDIADGCGVSHATVHGYLKKFNIPTRSRIESISKVKKPAKKKTQTLQEFLLKLKELDKVIKELEETQELEKALRGEESNYTSSVEVERNRQIAEGKRKRARIEKLRQELESAKDGATHAGNWIDQLYEIMEYTKDSV